MRVPKEIEKGIMRLWELNNEANRLDNKIRNWLQANKLVSSDGDGINGFSMDSYIDICEYGTSDPQELIDMLRQL